MSGRTGKVAPEDAERRGLRERLLVERACIQKEISCYPTPIAGCDEQFNFLQERLSQIRRELARIPERQ